jgi:hypothetical protein
MDCAILAQRYLLPVEKRLGVGNQLRTVHIDLTLTNEIPIWGLAL